MISFMLNIKIKKGYEKKAISALQMINNKAINDKGCIYFRWFQHIDEPVRFTLIEEWKNQDNQDDHINGVLDEWNEFVIYFAEDPESIKLKRLIE